MKCQKALFNLKEGVHYLNCAYKAPLLKSAEAACIKALTRERNPADISVRDFFDDTQHVREAFGQLINSQSEKIAIMPATSYGFRSVLSNIKGKKTGNAITVENEFPSGYFALKRWCKENQNELIVAKPPTSTALVGEAWNQNILRHITDNTSVVLLSSVHWMNGIQFNLHQIGQRCKKVGALLIVDGTQSVGALPIDVQAAHIDALICGAYKWLFGPYSMALAYLGDAFAHGTPIEDSWMNRTNAQQFSTLTDYEEAYTPHAGRFNVGQTSNFILMPMLRESLQQVNLWQPQNIQQYCQALIQPLVAYLTSLGVQFEPAPYFSNHLFALQLPSNQPIETLQQKLAEANIYVSTRGNYIRVSVNVFNDAQDILALIKVIKNIVSREKRF